MRLIRQRVNGALFRRPDQVALVLDDGAPPLYLRFALVLRGPESLVFPAFLLDDWGGEVRRLQLYDWLVEEGDRFPRAEVFGQDGAGVEIQRFVRDLELHFKLPCFAYFAPDDPVPAGARLSQVVIPAPGNDQPQEVEPPAGLAPPLRRAQVQWLAVDPERLTALGYEPVNPPG